MDGEQGLARRIIHPKKGAITFSFLSFIFFFFFFSLFAIVTFIFTRSLHTISIFHIISYRTPLIYLLLFYFSPVLFLLPSFPCLALPHHRRPFLLLPVFSLPCRRCSPLIDSLDSIISSLSFSFSSLYLTLPPTPPFPFPLSPLL
jgi:hypothetical protein